MSTAPATREASRPARTEGRIAWPAGLAWALWLLNMVALAVVPWMDRLLRQAGRPDLVQLTPGTAFPVVAMVSGATVGAVLASRPPRHSVGWLLVTLGSRWRGNHHHPRVGHQPARIEDRQRVPGSLLASSRLEKGVR